MKLLLKASFLFFISSKLLYADLLTDSNTVFDWGETNFPDILAPANQPTQFIEGWRYRFYPDTENYAGVNDAGEVFLLGKATANEISPVGNVPDLLKTINAGTPPSDEIHQLITLGDVNNCKNIPLLGEIGKTAKLEVTEGGFTGLSGTLSLLKMADNTVDIEINVFGTDVLTGSYEDKNLSGEPFRVFNFESSIFPLNVPLPFRWCEGMQWRSDLSKKEVNPAVNTYTIVSLNDTIELLDGSSRAAVKLSASIVESDKERTSFSWIDIATGYPLKVTVKEFGEGTAVSITDNEK